MLDFRTGQIFGLLMRTMPFLLLRIAVYIGITIAYVLAVGIAAASTCCSARSAATPAAARASAD
jgi:hypothetical protein